MYITKTLQKILFENTINPKSKKKKKRTKILNMKYELFKCQR